MTDRSEASSALTSSSKRQFPVSSPVATSRAPPDLSRSRYRTEAWPAWPPIDPSSFDRSSRVGWISPIGPREVTVPSQKSEAACWLACRFRSIPFVLHPERELQWRSGMENSRYRWVIVAAGGLLGCVAIGGMFSLPVFLQPLARDTGWSVTGISSAMTIGFLAMAFTSMIWGTLSDRLG